jgi:hypothetical protein
VVIAKRVPSAITPAVLAFCRQLDASRTPMWVDVEAESDVDSAHPFAGLRKHVSRHGGRIQYGWIIWENAGWYLEAEFSGAWCSPKGDLIALGTGREAGPSTRILFLPDSRRTFQGATIANRFHPLSASPDVLAVVQSAEYHCRLQADAETQARRAMAQPAHAERNAPCPCGSGLKFKKCCGRSTR